MVPPRSSSASVSLGPLASPNAQNRSPEKRSRSPSGMITFLCDTETDLVAEEATLKAATGVDRTRWKVGLAFSGAASFAANDLVRLKAALRELSVRDDTATSFDVLDGVGDGEFLEFSAEAVFETETLLGLRANFPPFTSNPLFFSMLSQSRAVASGTRFTLATSSTSRFLSIMEFAVTGPRWFCSAVEAIGAKSGEAA